MPEAKSYNTLVPRIKQTVMTLLYTSTTLQETISIARATLADYDFIFLRVLAYSNGAETIHGNQLIFPVGYVLNTDYIIMSDGTGSAVLSSKSFQGMNVGIYVAVTGYLTEMNCGIYWDAKANSNYLRKPTFKCLVYGIR